MDDNIKAEPVKKRHYAVRTIVVTVAVILLFSLVLALLMSLKMNTDTVSARVSGMRTVPVDMVTDAEGRFILLDYPWDADIDGCYSVTGDLNALRIGAVDPGDSSDATVNALIREYVSLNGTWERREDDIVLKGDTVEASYAAWENDRAIDAFTVNNAVFVLGEAGEPDDFVKALDGSATGRELAFDVTFPDDWSEAVYAGKTLQFTATVNAVLTVPAVDDEHISAMTRGYYDTAEAFMNDLVTGLEEYNRETYESEVRAGTAVALADAVTVSSVPDGILAWYVSFILRDYQDVADSAGTDIMEYMIVAGYDSVEDLVADVCTASYAYAKNFVMLEAAARELGISYDDVTDAEMYDERAAELMENMGFRTCEALEEYYGVENIKHDVRDRKVMNALMESAVLE